MRIQILRFAQDDIIKRTSEKLDWAIRMVLETEPKVHSRAIDEMREEVKELSNNVHSIERKQFGK